MSDEAMITALNRQYVDAFMAADVAWLVDQTGGTAPPMRPVLLQVRLTT